MSQQQVTDNAATHELRRHIRFADLVKAGIVGNWPTLLRLIETEGFPPGVMIGRNMRGWQLDQVEAWLASRPTGRKVVVPAKKPRGRRRKTAAGA
jgi:predicted DNA-binding transcriptional regulator AlpA